MSGRDLTHESTKNPENNPSPNLLCTDNVHYIHMRLHKLDSKNVTNNEKSVKNSEKCQK